MQAAQTLGGALQGGWSHPFSGGALTAHLKIDPSTGEAVGLTYAANAEPWAMQPEFARHDVRRSPEGSHPRGVQRVIARAELLPLTPCSPCRDR